MKARARATVRALPAWVALPLLAVVGALEWWLRPRQRQAPTAHMGLVLRGTAREGEVRTLARRHMVRRRQIDQLLWRPDVCARGHVEHAAMLERLRARGEGAIVMHTHLCSIAPQVFTLCAHGHVDAIVVTFDDPPSALQQVFLSEFDRYGVETIQAAGSYELILARLRAGRLCHIAIDVPGSTPCVFLDKPARLASGIGALALASGVPIVPAVPGRPSGHIRVRLEDPVPTDDAGGPAALSQRLADVASAQILAAPELYHDHEWLRQLWPSGVLSSTP